MDIPCFGIVDALDETGIQELNIIESLAVPDKAKQTDKRSRQYVEWHRLREADREYFDVKAGEFNRVLGCQWMIQLLNEVAGAPSTEQRKNEALCGHSDL
jgi:hypothetical protein